ncbi:MAG TPA: RNase H family protein [Pirellulaceae bacterium]|nr:RNase H family protein [Pirellulaceae bacterium]
MSVPAPHFLLFSTARNDRPPHEPAAGQWRFVLKAVDGSSQLEATDHEDEVSRDRLELLAIVRGLEALDQASTVTVVTTSRYIARGLRFGLPTWRENSWQWERFGELVTIKNVDLWQRIDRAMQIHNLVCRYSVPTAVDEVQVQTVEAVAILEPVAVEIANNVPPARVEQPRVARRQRGIAQRLSNSVDLWTRSLSALWTKPHLGAAAS